MPARRHLSHFRVAMAACALIPCAVAAELPADVARRVDAVFAEHARPGAPGCAFALLDRGEVVYQRGYGLANLEHGVAIDPRRTVFDIGSTSKQFTAAAVLLLANDGKLALDDDIRKFVPELPDAGATVTLRHLLHHTSGMPDYLVLMSLAGFNYEDLTTDDDALRAIVRRNGLDFAPGSEHSYSNTGYFLLSLVVKRVSGQPLREFARQRIFAPLGMDNTRILDDHTAVIAHRAASYERHNDGSYSAALANWEQTGDGAVQTTVGDLAKWDRNFYAPKVGGPWLVEQLQTTGVLNDGKSIDYARGLVVGKYRGLRTVHHGGAWAGFRANVLRFPDRHVSGIALCNVGNADPDALLQRVADIYLADALGPVDAAHPVTAAANAALPADAGRHVGLYANLSTGQVRRVALRDGTLWYVRGKGNETALTHIGDGRFQMADMPSAVVAFSGEAPASRQLELRYGGSVTRMDEVQAAEPDANALRAYQGRYASTELDAQWTLLVEGGQLMLQDRRGPPRPLAPAFADAFTGPKGLMRFQRDGDNRVAGFALTLPRARALQFSRSAAAK